MRAILYKRAEGKKLFLWYPVGNRPRNIFPEVVTAIPLENRALEPTLSSR